MKISTKKTTELVEGDILIIDWLEIETTHMPIYMKHPSKAAINQLRKKFEGESMIFLFEIDDIDIEYSNSEKEEGSIYTFYSIDDLYAPKGMAAICVEDMDNYEWTVINNPYHTLEHYKKRIHAAT